MLSSSTLAKAALGKANKLKNLDLTDIQNQINLINKKIDSIASVFNITFNDDGTLSSEAYSTHTHDYTDKWVEDTSDGTGVTNTDSKITGAVN